MFYSPDGSKCLSITANPSGPGVYAVTYMKMSSTLTTHEMGSVQPIEPVVQIKLGDSNHPMRNRMSEEGRSFGRIWFGW